MSAFGGKADMTLSGNPLLRKGDMPIVPAG
jgi:hypothetical protein